MTMIPDAVLHTLRPQPHGTTAGWIFPDGSVVKADVMKHRDALPEEFRLRYDVLLQEQNEIMYSMLDCLEEGEHPAMHRFDPDGEALSMLMQELAEKYYIRFGIWGGTSNSLELSTSVKSSKHHHAVIAYMVAAFDIRKVTLVDITTLYHTRTRLKQYE